MIKKMTCKNSEKSESFKCSLYFMICNLFQKGIAFLTVPLFTRMMSTDEYGQFTVFQSWLQIIALFTSLNIGYGVLNKALVKYKNKDRYISVVQMLYTVITISLFILYNILKPFFGNLLNIPFWIEVIMLIELIVTPSLTIYSVKSRFEYKYVSVTILTILLIILNPILGIVFVKNSTEKGLARILSYLIAQICVCGLVYFYNFYKGKKIYNLEYWKYTLRFSIPLIPYFLSSLILNQSDKIMISIICGNSYAGIYSIAFSIAMLMKILNESINSSLVPWLYKNLSRNSKYGIASKLNYIISIVALANLLLMIFSPECIKIVASAKYTSAVYIMPALSNSVCLIFIITIFNNIEMYFERNSFIMKTSIIISFLNIILNYFFITIFGYLAAAYTTLVCYIVLLFIHIYYCKKEFIDINKYIDFKFVIIISTILSVISIFVPLLFPLTYFRIFISMIILLIVTINIYKKRGVLLD